VCEKWSAESHRLWSNRHDGADRSGEPFDGLALAVPAYTESDHVWQRLVAARDAVAFAVLNVVTGPGDRPVDSYRRHRAAARGAGLQVLAYVDTAYADRPAGEVLDEVDRYQRWYDPDGVFLDRTPSSCDHLAHYAAITDAIRQRAPDALLVYNPGTNPGECYMQVADVVLTFEGHVDEYRAHTPADWLRRYPAARCWHLVYGVADQHTLRDVLGRSRRHGAGLVYVTPGTMPNPWDDLPPADYWQAELDEIRHRR
jgi:hypothetical protein